jgi:hypothetical protein
MVNLFGVFSGFGSGIVNALKWSLYFSPLIILIIYLAIHYRNKFLYKYKVRVFRERENGKVKESNFVAGYINRKNSAPFFRIKTGKWWWQYLDLTETPKVQYMDEDDRVYYKQIDINSYVQMRRIIEGDRIKFTPVESDVKYGAVLSVQRIKEALRTESTLKKILPYAALLTLGIIFIVAYAMLMNKCGG